MYWWIRTRKEKRSRDKWRKLMHPLSAQLGAPVEVIDTPWDSQDADLRIDGRFQGYQVEAECWLDGGKHATRVLRVKLKDPLMPKRGVLERMGDNRINKDLRRGDKFIEFRRSEHHKAHRWTNWERVLNDMVAAAKDIREEGRRRSVPR